MDAINERFDSFPLSIYNSVENVFMLEEPNEHVKRDASPLICRLDPKTFRIFWDVRHNSKEMANYFNYVLKGITETSSLKEFKWKTVHKRYTKMKDNAQQNNIDVTLSFRHFNTFLVKAFFTFGIRRTGAEEYHLVQTYKTPMMFYVPNRTLEPERERTFKYFDQGSYKAFILEPKSVYAVPPQTEYILFTVQKTLFALDKVTKNVIRSMEMNGTILKSPISTAFIPTKKKRKIMYTTPQQGSTGTYCRPPPSAMLQEKHEDLTESSRKRLCKIQDRRIKSIQSSSTFYSPKPTDALQSRLTKVQGVAGSHMPLKIETANIISFISPTTNTAPQPPESSLIVSCPSATAPTTSSAKQVIICLQSSPSEVFKCHQSSPSEVFMCHQSSPTQNVALPMDCNSYSELDSTLHTPEMWPP